MGQQRHRVGGTRRGGLACLLLLSVLLSACEKDPADGAKGGDLAGTEKATRADQRSGSEGKGSEGSDEGSDEDGETSYAVDAPGKFRPPLRTADVLITSTEPIDGAFTKRVAGVDGVRAVVPLSMASSSIDGRTLTVAAADPAALRPFTPDDTANAQFVWDRLAGGEVAVDPATPKRLIDKDDNIRLGTRDDSPVVHVGAYAPLVQRSAGLSTIPVAQVVVNPRRGEQLGLPEENALLVSTGSLTPSKLKKKFKAMLPPKASLQILALEFKNTSQTAVLAGTSVSEAIGKFSYTNGPDGTINPDPAWVREYIRTEEIPILGTVTGNKAYLPQLRAAMDEIQRSGLAGEINPEEYAGCYYPRYIGRSPSNGLSLHSWGIAVDLNVPGNQRGTVGEMDRRVVAIMEKWGMSWGGNWSYTDPMHFEMDEVRRPG